MWGSPTRLRHSTALTAWGAVAASLLTLGEMARSIGEVWEPAPADTAKGLDLGDMALHTLGVRPPALRLPNEARSDEEAAGTTSTRGGGETDRVITLARSKGDGAWDELGRRRGGEAICKLLPLSGMLWFPAKGEAGRGETER